MSEKCGGLHSVKWYKENSRVFVYSPISNFKNAEVQSLLIYNIILQFVLCLIHAQKMYDA